VYGLRMGIIHQIVAAGLCWFLGFRGLALIAGAVVGFFVLSFLTGLVIRRFWPPPLEIKAYNDC
jgi:Na+(H+)/acetate symporter ActP